MTITYGDSGDCSELSFIPRYTARPAGAQRETPGSAVDAVVVGINATTTFAARRGWEMDSS